MKASDRKDFADLMTDALAFYRQDATRFVLDVWWAACEGYELEQLRKALTAHAMDPERGQFPPKPADIVRVLQGTRTDRALVAWGKVFEAMRLAGAYNSVAFDDQIIHAALADMGGWVKVARSTNDELPHVQRRFCDTYKAYASSSEPVSYQAVLMGASEADNALRGYRSSPPLLIGNPDQAQRVMELGSRDAGKTRVSVAQLAGPRPLGSVLQLRAPQ